MLPQSIGRREQLQALCSAYEGAFNRMFSFIKDKIAKWKPECYIWSSIRNAAFIRWWSSQTLKVYGFYIHPTNRLHGYGPCEPHLRGTERGAAQSMLVSVAVFSFDAILGRSSFGANSRCRPPHSSISVHSPIQYHMLDFVPPMFCKGFILNALPITI